MSIYSKLIIELTGCTPEEAPLVEGFMRNTYGTLDNISRAVFKREAKIGLATAKANPILAEDNARSYGLLPKKSS